MYVMKVESLKLENISIFSFMWFFTLLIGSAPITFFSTPTCLHVCVFVFVCVCVELKFINLQNVVSLDFQLYL